MTQDNEAAVAFALVFARTLEAVILGATPAEAVAGTERTLARPRHALETR